ncbi:hypothetical protein Peur_014541 [Populus x canadensis]
MDVEEKNAPFRRFVNPPSGDQHLLLYFIMSILEACITVLRNAHPSLVLNPNMLCFYLKGKLHLSGSGALEDCRLIIKKCLCYEHGSQKGGEETEQTLMPFKRKLRALFLLDMRNHQQCFNRKQKGSPLQPSSAGTEESSFGRSCKLDESTFCCFS